MDVLNIWRVLLRAGFKKAIKGEQVIDKKYTLENLFSGNLTIEDIPSYPEYMTMIGATVGAKYRGLWNSAKGTYHSAKMLVTEPEKALEVASNAILDFMEHPWNNAKEFVGAKWDDLVNIVWKSTPQEIAEEAGEALGDTLTAIAIGGGGKAAASGAKVAGNKLLTAGNKTIREFAEVLESLATNQIVSEGVGIGEKILKISGDVEKPAVTLAKGIASNVDDVGKAAVTKGLVENALIGIPVVEGVKKTGNIIKDELLDKAIEQTIDIVKDEIIDTVQSVAEENSKIIESEGHTE